MLNTRKELFIGIKTTGQFQHSSFLYGGRVLSAGLLKCKDGLLTSLSPLSGHYRAGTAHFRHFVSLLQEKGVDLSKVTLSKSLLMLAAMEKYGKAMKKKDKKSKGKKKGKDKGKDDKKGGKEAEEEKKPTRDEQGRKFEEKEADHEEPEEEKKGLRERLGLKKSKSKTPGDGDGEAEGEEDKPHGLHKLLAKLKP